MRTQHLDISEFQALDKQMCCLRNRTKWDLREVERSSDGNYVLLYNTPEGMKEIKTRSVALTVPAYVAADLVRRECPDAAAFLKGIDYPPVAAVSLAYPMSSLRQDRLNAEGKLPGVPSASQGVASITLYVPMHPVSSVCPLCSCNEARGGTCRSSLQ